MFHYLYDLPLVFKGGPILTLSKILILVFSSKWYSFEYPLCK